MLHTGLLARFLPAFKMVINRIQYDEYHIYPVGRHLLRTVMLLKQIKDLENGNGDPLAAELWTEVKSKKLLLWGALLHDIGKGQPGKNHSARGEALIPEILGEKGYPPEDIETVDGSGLDGHRPQGLEQLDRNPPAGSLFQNFERA